MMKNKSITKDTGKTVSFQLNNGKGILIDSYGKKLPLPKGVSTTYQGENKIKTVNTVFADSIYLDAKDSIHEYEKLLVVDTNSKKSQQFKYCDWCNDFM